MNTNHSLRKRTRITRIYRIKNIRVIRIIRVPLKNSVLRVPSVLAHPVRTRANAQRSERSDNSLHHSIHNLIPRDLIRVRIQV